MTKEEIIKSWIPRRLDIPEEDDKNDPDFISVYTGSYAHDSDVFETNFIVNCAYNLDIKNSKLKIKEDDMTVRFPFFAYVAVEDFVSSIFDVMLGSASDNYHKSSKSRISLVAAALLDKKDLTVETSYTDAIWVKMSAPVDENGAIGRFEDCSVSITLSRIFSSIPEDFINIKCSEAYDKMKDIQKEMKDNLDESLVYKIEQNEKEGGKERVVFVDCMLISLRDMYKSIEALDAYYKKK